MTEPLTVLVAEDEALIRMDLVETLEELGFRVVAAVGDGRRAVEAASELRPNMALLDIKMPDMDGLAAASEIVGLDSTAVVMLTAFSQPELIQRAVAAGAMGYLVKPYKPDELRASLTVAWQRYSQLRGEQQKTRELAQTLADRKTIERARGVVQERLGLSEDEAYSWLRKAAMDQRLPLVEVARRTLRG
jgi:response regulator NasT